MAEREVIIQVQSCNLELASEVMWFVNEWCKETGRTNPRVKMTDNGQAFTIHTDPFKSDEQRSS